MAYKNPRKQRVHVHALHKSNPVRTGEFKSMAIIGEGSPKNIPQPASFSNRIKLLFKL
jgi:hypothetical protein